VSGGYFSASLVWVFVIQSAFLATRARTCASVADAGARTVSLPSGLTSRLKVLRFERMIWWIFMGMIPGGNYTGVAKGLEQGERCRQLGLMYNQ